MKVLNDKEIAGVSGGVCEGMTQSECYEGVGDRIVTEFSAIGAALGNTMSSLYDSYRSAAGGLGIWLYNVTHDC